jgi:hypothetical protein
MLRQYLGKRYEPQEGETACWSFCREAGLTLGFSLPFSVWELSCAGAAPILNSVVLFRFPDNSWHAGIIWPDCVHFVHAAERPSGLYIRKERLNQLVLPYVKGYYVGDRNEAN